MAASTALLVGGLALSAASQAQQGRASESTLKKQAKIERQEAAIEEEKFRREQSRLAAARRAALGASGVRSGVGSPLLVSEDFASEAELQALRIRSGGKARSDLLKNQAAAAKTAGFARGGSGLVSGASKLFG